MEKLKKCTQCNKFKNHSFFSAEKRTKIGLQSKCKKCINENGRKEHHRNREKNLYRHKLYRIKNQEKLSKKSREKYWNNIEENREKKRKYANEYYKKNRKKVLLLKSNWRKKNKEKSRISEKLWKENNPEKYKIKNRRNNSRRKLLAKKDGHIRLNMNMSDMIRRRLKSRLSGKNGKNKNNYLPYTTNELITHLENQFTEGMNWNNYGKWHLDHIIPDSSFKYTSVNDVEFQKCWALKNLQPLWAIDNQKKGNKIINIKTQKIIWN